VLNALGKSIDSLKDNRFIQTKYDIGEAKSAIRNILMQDPPSALICGNDVIAQGAVYACQSLGLNIPNDISIIGIGDFQGSAHMEPKLTTVRLPAQRIGEQAADLLCTSLAITSGASGKAVPRIKIDSELMVRNSVKKLS
jgi:LacI family transcriptional regulator